MEKIVSAIEAYCTFPVIEKLKLFRLTFFNFLIGNEDVHLKNFSLIRKGNKSTLSPVYDLLNTSILMHVKEDIALPLRGKKSKLSRSDLVEYFGMERLGLSESILEQELAVFKNFFIDRPI